MASFRTLDQPGVESWRYDVLTMATGVNLMSAGHSALGSSSRAKIRARCLRQTPSHLWCGCNARHGSCFFDRDCETPLSLAMTEEQIFDFTVPEGKVATPLAFEIKASCSPALLYVQADAGVQVMSLCPSAGRHQLPGEMCWCCC